MLKTVLLALLSALATASPLGGLAPSFASSSSSSLSEHSFKKRRPLPPLPDNDPWYAAPDNLADAKPGDILKWRVSPRPISIDNVGAVNLAGVYHIQYRTQNSVGEPLANVVTAIVPYNANLNVLFAYNYFSDTADPTCNPSVAMTLTTADQNIWTKEQLGPVISALDEGWIVGVPDDGGPQASFPAGPNMAYTTLDSIRAMLQSEAITGLKSTASVTLNGYSGGGITAAWTGELHGLYAPEVRIDGIALGGLVPDFVYLASIIKAGQGYFAWGPVTYAGLSHDYRDLSDWLDENLDPAKAAEFWQVETFNIAQIEDFYVNRPTCDYFTRGCAAMDDTLPANILYNATTMGIRSTPKAPWYLYETVGDETSPIQLTRDLYNKYCAQGADIYYEENQIPLSHSDESVYGFPGAFQWMKDRHAGQPLPFKGCQQTSVSTDTIEADGLLTAAQAAYQASLALSGLPVGNFAWNKILP